MSISVDFMIKQYLESMGADGLCNPDEECGCDLDDLAPCDCLNLEECKAARKMKAEPDSRESIDFGEEYYQVIE